jgi:hypothetical protein
MFKPRSNSNSSVGSTASSRSRTSDMIAHIVAQSVRRPAAPLTQPTSIYLWSAGNVRINGRDLGVDALEALELAGAFRSDRRVRPPRAR